MRLVFLEPHDRTLFAHPKWQKVHEIGPVATENATLVLWHQDMHIILYNYKQCVHLYIITIIYYH